MFREPLQQKNQEQIKPSENRDDFDYENLVKAFDLLLRIDMRINPDLYKIKPKKKRDD